MLDADRRLPHVAVKVQSLHEEPGDGGQHGVVHHGRRGHARAVAAEVGDALVHQEGQVEQEHGHEEVHQDLGALARFAFPAESCHVSRRRQGSKAEATR